jgi:hypothetical protein
MLERVLPLICFLPNMLDDRIRVDQVERVCSERKVTPVGGHISVPSRDMIRQARSSDVQPAS